MELRPNQKITPYLWFESGGQQAAEYYVSIFPNSKITSRSPMVTSFQLCNQRFSILEAGPHHPFNDAVSFYINCSDQQEVDYYWGKLLQGGGKESMCGWLQDKYGVRWQVVPEALLRLTTTSDEVRSKKVFDAMLKMKKIIVKDLEKAYDL